MSKKCHQCGRELTDNLKFCTSCGAKQDLPIYPIVKRYKLQNILYILFLIVFIIPFAELAKNPDDYTILIVAVFLIIFALCSIFVYFGTLSQKFYVVNCPYCNQQLLFPIEEKGINCSCCNKRVIMTNGKIKKVEEDIKNENL